MSFLGSAVEPCTNFRGTNSRLWQSINTNDNTSIDEQSPFLHAGNSFAKYSFVEQVFLWNI